MNLYESLTEMNVYIVPFWSVLNEQERADNVSYDTAVNKAKKSACYIGKSRRREFGGGLRFQGSQSEVLAAITSLANQ